MQCQLISSYTTSKIRNKLPRFRASWCGTLKRFQGRNHLNWVKGQDSSTPMSVSQTICSSDTHSNTAGAMSQSEGSFRATLSETTKTGDAMWLVAFPWKVSSGCRSKRRPCVPSFTMLKWSCHLNGSLCQISDHRIRYRHCNGHLKASKWGAFLLTGLPWHLPGLG